MFEKLDDSKKNSEKIAYESKTYIADAWNRFKKNKLALIGLCFLLVMAIGCIFVPIFSSYTYDGQNMANTFAGPSMDHIFGTDRFGRDDYVRWADLTCSWILSRNYFFMCWGYLWGYRWICWRKSRYDYDAYR